MPPKITIFPDPEIKALLAPLCASTHQALTCPNMFHRAQVSTFGEGNARRGGGARGGFGKINIFFCCCSQCRRFPPPAAVHSNFRSRGGSEKREHDVTRRGSIGTTTLTQVGRFRLCDAGPGVVSVAYSDGMFARRASPLLGLGRADE